MIHVELHVKLYAELTTKETEIIMNQCYMTSQTDQKLSINWTFNAQAENRSHNYNNQKTYHSLSFLSLPFFVFLETSFVCQLQKNQIICCNKIYLHCNIIFCGPEGSKKGGGGKGWGKGKGEVKGGWKGGWQGRIHPTSKLQNHQEHLQSCITNVFLHIQVQVRTMLIKKLLTHNHINM